MIGPQTMLEIETVLAERAREVRLAESLARLHWNTPGRGGYRTRVWGWLRELASRLAQPPARPQCCPQIA